MKFSFFVTSVGALQKLSQSEQGFGGDLRFGKRSGLEGADELCRQSRSSPSPAPAPRAGAHF